VTWAKVDDRLHSHPKPRKAGAEAMGLWALALSYCADHLTDGRIDRGAVWGLAINLGVPLRRVEGWSEKTIERLVLAGLWKAEPDGAWRFHDWHDHQPSRAQVLDIKEKRQRAGQASAAARVKQDAQQDVPTPVALRARDPVPSRPVPSDPDQPPTPYRGSDSEQSSPPPSPAADPWELAPAGGDPDAPPIGDRDVKPEKVSKPSKTDLALESLSPFERRIAEAIVADVSLAPICPRPRQLARDLNLAAPSVDVVREVRSLGAWLRQNPAKAKKNGGAFLLRNITKKQERGGGGRPPEDPSPAPTAAPVLDAPKAPPLAAAAAAIAARVAAEERGEARPAMALFADLGKMPDEDDEER
jgi:hypothetical protein